MTAKIIDGKQVAAGIRAELKDEVARLKERGIVPGLGVILVGEDPASEVVRDVEGAGLRGDRDLFRRQSPARGDLAGGADGPRPADERRPENQRHPGPIAAAAPPQRVAGAPGHRSGQGRRRVPPDQCREDGRGGEGVSALHAARRSAVAPAQRRDDRRGARGDRGPQQHRRQAPGQHADPEEPHGQRDCHGLPHADERPCPLHAPGGYRHRRRGPAQHDHGRHGQGRRRRDRRRRQSRGGPDASRRASGSSATWISRP